MNDGGHDMPLSQDGFTSHFIFTKELTTATIDINSLILFVTLVVSFIIIFFFSRLYLFLNIELSEYFKRRHLKNSHIIRLAIISWLSLFELSPNFIKSA